MQYRNQNLGDVRKKLYVFTAATGRANIPLETMDRLYDELIDAMDVAVREHYRDS